MISNVATQSFITSASSNVPKAAYFSTLDSAFVYIREYIEDNLGENVSVCVKETTLCINGKEKDLYEVSFGAAQQYITIPYTPLTSPNPYIPDTTPLKDDWWKSPYVYCGPVPQVTLNEGAAGSDYYIDTKAGCIMQSYGAKAGAAPQA